MQDKNGLPSFRTKDGTRWTIEFTYGTMKRIRALTGLDLTDIQDGRPLLRLANEWALLADVLFLAVEEQAKGRGITDEDFGAMLDARALEEASEALPRAVLNFSPKHLRKGLEAALKAALEAQEETAEAVAEYASSPRMRKKIEELQEEAIEGIDRDLASGRPGSR
jgi:hypothetical protein